MKKKLLATLACMALMSLAFAGLADARGTSAKVTIKANTIGFYGYVKSSKDKCASGREVKLFRITNSGKEKVGSDEAQANNDGYMWAIGVDRGGKYYAKVSATDNGCDSAKSKILKAEL